MKPKPFDPLKHIIPRYAHAKLDGIRLKIQRELLGEGRGPVQFITSNGIDIERQLITQEWWPEVVERFPRGEMNIIVDAELTSEHGFEYIKTALANGERLKLEPFATTALEPSAPLDDVSAWMWDHFRLSIPPYFDRVNYDSDDEDFDHRNDDAWLKMLDHHAIHNGFEGWVFKDGNYLNWLKRKPVMTIDLIVKGAKDGNNANIGLLGSLELMTTEGHVVCNCSGMTHDQRLDLTNMWAKKDLFGRIIEVAYDRVSSKGRLRFPRFKRIRDDKIASECGVNQDPELARYWS